MSIDKGESRLGDGIYLRGSIRHMFGRSRRRLKFAFHPARLVAGRRDRPDGGVVEHETIVVKLSDAVKEVGVISNGRADFPGELGQTLEAKSR